MQRMSNYKLATSSTLANREPFTANNLAGERIGRDGRAPDAGRLAGASRDAYQRAQIGLDLGYVVLSYYTPIAWYSYSAGWHVVADRFSVTTSRHQSYVRQGLTGETVAA